MFFKVGSIKNFAIFTGKKTVFRSLFNKAAGLKICNFFKNKLQHRCFLWILQNFEGQFSYTTPPVAVSDSPPTVQQSQLGCLFFDFAPPRAFDFDLKLSRNVAQIILYYHVTKQFLSCLDSFVTCFRFQNMFWKNMNCFRF